MGEGRSLQPGDFATRRDLVLVDLRPTSERHSEVGFLPASLSLPRSTWDDAEAPLAELAALDDVSAIALYCTSGRRSLEARAALEALSAIPVWNLEGGFLAWEAAGLPVCRVSKPPAEHPRTVLEYRRHLLACFVGANAELALDKGARTEPYQLLLECFERAGVPWEEPTIDGLYRVLDWASIATFRAGGNLADIAENVGGMVTMLRALEQE
jgi:rhodanese-related sulfurtransferase